MLELIAVGTGRDGTLSLTGILGELLVANGRGGQVMHEYHSREFYNHYCCYKETGDEAHMAAIRKLIAECSYTAIVGNGYAWLLPMFKEIWPNAKLIHLKRRNRQDCIDSFKESVRLYPDKHIHYSDLAEGDIQRIAAFHEGLMTRDQWHALSLDEKFGWYYDYTHQQISQHAPLFGGALDVATEDLQDDATMKALAQFVFGARAQAVAGQKLNSTQYVSASDFPPEYIGYVQWLFGRMDKGKVLEDISYPARYFANNFIAWIGYHESEMAAQVCTAMRQDDDRRKEALSAFIQEMKEHIRVAEAVRKSLR